MATSTPHLNLSLLSTGESVGTWGIPLNNNFSKIDVLAGEVINSRGSESDVNSRFNAIEGEIEDARGIMPTLADRLNVLLGSDGNINIEAVPKASFINIGVTRLSVDPVTTLTPIAVGDNDGRMLTQGEHDSLVNGSITALHKHLLVDGAYDVTATYTDINRALDGAGTSVTAANLTSLTDGSIISGTGVHTHQAAGLATLGFVKTSVSPLVALEPVAVETNDPRVLTQVNHDLLTTNNITSIHRHNLVDGAADLTVTATVLNQLAGAGASVTASNLNTLTLGAPAGVGALDASALHHHDNIYYRKAEIDSHITALNDALTSDIETHNTSDTSHAGANFTLGDINVDSLASHTGGTVVEIHSLPLVDAGNGAEPVTTSKFMVRDGGGLPVAYIDAGGNLTVNDFDVKGNTTIIGETTVDGDYTVNQDFLVLGHSTLGEPGGTSTNLIRGATTLNGNLAITGVVTGATTYNGIDIVALDTAHTATIDEVIAARQLEVDLLTNIAGIKAVSTTFEEELFAARGGTYLDTVTSLDVRLDAADVYMQATEAEVNKGRGGTHADLDARFIAVETAGSNHEIRNDNPHLVTMTQTIAQESLSFDTADLIMLTGGPAEDAQTQHTHANVDLELTNCKTSSIELDPTNFPGKYLYATVDERIDAGDQASRRMADAIVASRTDNDAKLYTTLSERLDFEQAEFDAFVGLDSNPHLVTFTQAVAADPGTTVTALQMENLINGTNADSLHIHAKYDITTQEVETARGGALSLTTRLDNMDIGLSTHEDIITGNPHNVTLTESVASDLALVNVTIINLEGLTGGTNADSLHIHAKYDLNSDEIFDARGGKASLLERLDITDTELITARSSELYGAFGALDSRLEMPEQEILLARDGEVSLSAKLTAVDAAVALNTVKPNKYIETVASSLTWTITHNLNTFDISVMVYDDSNNVIFQTGAPITGINVVDANTVGITFDTTTAGRVVIVG